MKNYILGIIAIVMAIGFSAFTAHQPTQKKFVNYWYYRVDAATNEIKSSSDLVNTSSSMSHSTFASTFPGEICSGAGQDCLRGFTSQLATFPNSDVPQDEFQKP